MLNGGTGWRIWRCAGPSLAIWAIAFAIMAPELVAGLSVTASIRFNIVWTDQFNALVAQGWLYPRWLPASWDGLGSPTFYFYPPLAFAVIAGLNQLSAGAFSTGTLISLGSVLGLGSSGVALRAWLRHCGSGPRPSLIGAVAYMLAPYHLYEIYGRGALAEAWSYAFLPVILLAIDHIAERRKYGVTLLTAAYGCLIFSHLPVALLATVFLIPSYISFRAWHLPDRRPFLLHCLLGGLLGLALSAAYLLPALTLLPFVSSAALHGPGFMPAASFFWHGQGLNDPKRLLIATVTIGGALLSLAAAVGRRERPEVIYWGALAVTLAVLIAGAVPFIWRLPLLNQIQFAWRALVIVELATIAAMALAWPKFSRPVLAIALVPTSIAVLIAGAFIADRARNARATSAANVETARAEYRDAPEYLPAGTLIPLSSDGPDPSRVALPDAPRARVLLPTARLVARDQPGGGMWLAIESPGATQVIVRRFFFPHWHVFDRNGTEQRIFRTPDGLVSWPVPAGRTTYRLLAGPAPLEREAEAVSALAVLLLIVMSIYRRFRSRRVD